VRISSAGWSFERPCNFLTEHPSFLHYRCPHVRSCDINQSPLQPSTFSHKNAGGKIPGRILQQQCWSTRVKARLQSGSWRKISDIKSSGTNDILHLANPKSRNEGKVHRIRLSAEPGKLHRQITYASTSSPRLLFQPTEIIGGWLSFPTVRLHVYPSRQYFRASIGLVQDRCRCLLT
jgi:hypothetical protein